MRYITIKDANGNIVAVTPQEFTNAMASQMSTIFGMTINTILALQEEYIKRNGPYNMTPESVRQVFSDKAKGL